MKEKTIDEIYELEDLRCSTTELRRDDSNKSRVGRNRTYDLRIAMYSNSAVNRCIIGDEVFKPDTDPWGNRTAPVE